MVKGRAERLHSIMTGHTIRTKRQEVFGRKSLVDLQMAITARILIERRGVSIYVTIFTCKCSVIRLGLMRGQFEGNFAVVKCGRTPACGTMTSSALVAKSTFVRIILGVARGAVRRRTFEDIVDMATLTDYGRVFTGQVECRVVMIKCGWLPASRRMAGCTLAAKSTRMNIILGVT